VVLRWPGSAMLTGPADYVPLDRIAAAVGAVRGRDRDVCRGPSAASPGVTVPVIWPLLLMLKPEAGRSALKVGVPPVESVAWICRDTTSAFRCLERGPGSVTVTGSEMKPISLLAGAVRAVRRGDDGSVGPVGRVADVDRTGDLAAAAEREAGRQARLAELRLPPVASWAWICRDTTAPSAADCSPGSVIVTAGAMDHTKVWLALAPLASAAVKVTNVDAGVPGGRRAGDGATVRVDAQAGRQARLGPGEQGTGGVRGFGGQGDRTAFRAGLIAGFVTVTGSAINHTNDWLALLPAVSVAVTVDSKRGPAMKASMLIVPVMRPVVGLMLRPVGRFVAL